MNEQWRSVVGFEGLYEVSDLGNVRGLDRLDSCGRKLNGVSIKPHSISGYKAICLHNGKQSTHHVHRLVLEAFIGPCPDGMESCHYPDSNRWNANLKNLRWDTRKNNCLDCKMHDHGPDLERNGRAKLIREEIYRIRDIRRAGVSYRNISEYFRVCEATIWNVVNGKTWATI